MRFTPVAVALASLAVSADSTRQPQSSPKQGGKKFTLTQVYNENFQGHDVPAAFARAHLKYGHELPAQLFRAFASDPELKVRFQAQDQPRPAPPNGTQRAKVTASAPPKYDSEFSVPVQIGTPPQTLPLNLDTGSGDLWTFSSDSYPNSLMNQTLYRPEKSSTSKVLRGESWVVKYGDGAGASGIVYTDRVQVGDTHVDVQCVQAAITASPDIGKNSFTSGILGLANSRVNTARPTQQRTYIDNIKDVLEKPLFTANLRRAAPGNYNFGYIDDSEHEGTIQYTPVHRDSPFWKVSLNGFQVGSDAVKQRGWDAIVDTGTSLMLLPPDMVEEYWKHVRGAGIDLRRGVITFPCEEQPPDFYFQIGPYRGRVPGAYMNYGRVDWRYCHGGIQTAKGIPFAVLGAVALKAQFVVFNYREGTVGFANKKLDVDAPRVG